MPKGHSRIGGSPPGTGYMKCLKCKKPAVKGSNYCMNHRPKLYYYGKRSNKPQFSWNELYQAYATFWLFGFIAGFMVGLLA